MTKEEKNEKHLENLKSRRENRIKSGDAPEELIDLENEKKLHKILYNMIKISNEKLNNYELEITGNIPNIEDRPIILAPNHVRQQDIEIIMQAFPKHMFLLSGDHKNVHGSFPGFLLEKNGIIYFDMKDKKDRENVKYVIKYILYSNVNLLWYYEGSWNLSENKIIYDGNYFIVQAAIDSNALVLPVSFDLIEQVGTKKRKACINFGDVIDYRKLYGKRNLSHEEKISALAILKSKIADGILDIWDKHSFCKRDDLAKQYEVKPRAEDYFIPDYKKESPLCEYWKNYKKKVLSEWKFSEKDIEEKHFVDKNIVDQKDAFEHLDNLKLNYNNAFLLSKKNHH